MACDSYSYILVAGFSIRMYRDSERGSYATQNIHTPNQMPHTIRARNRGQGGYDQLIPPAFRTPDVPVGKLAWHSDDLIVCILYVLPVAPIVIA